MEDLSLDARMRLAADPDRERNAALARILVDLDRCVHGRHSTDRCLSCPDGWSTGNTFLPAPGRRVGTDLYGNALVVPDARTGRYGHMPASWRRPACPRDTDGDGNCGQRYCPDCGETADIG